MRKPVLAILTVTCFLAGWATTGATGIKEEGPVKGKIELKKAGLSGKDRKAWHKILKWTQSWEDEYEAGPLGSDSEEPDSGFMKFFPLGQGKYLVEIQITVGAYAATFGYCYYDETSSPPTANVLTFQVFEEKGGKINAKEEQQLVGMEGMTSLNPREFTFAGPYRSAGDCGFRAVYVIQDGKAKLKEFRAKFKCDGKQEDPLKYPLIFPIQ